MYYTVYKVTNKISGKLYVGTHKTENLDDGYMGSGKYLKHAINKYGLGNFEKEILFIFDNPDDMFGKEAEIVNEDFIAEENTYNLRVGGFGGWDYANKKYSKEDRERLSAIANIALTEKMNNDTEFRKNQLDKRSKSMVKRWEDSQYRNAVCASDSRRNSFKGKTHSAESKTKIGQANSRKQRGSKNSQYGTRWIHSLKERRSVKIKKSDPIPTGWFLGRKIKFNI